MAGTSKLSVDTDIERLTVGLELANSLLSKVPDRLSSTDCTKHDQPRHLRPQTGREVDAADAVITHLSAAVKAGRLQVGVGVSHRVRDLGRWVAQLQWHNVQTQQQ